MNIADFEKLPLMGIVRGIDPDTVEPLAETIAVSGLRTVEITMNTQGAPQLIKRMKVFAKGRFVVGAGTVLDTDQFKEAVDAGAEFIVSPVLISEVLKNCLKRNIPAFPGALTPSEIYRAWKAGAAMVKVFPAKSFGPEYFKEIKGPFSQIKLLACGGVTPENLRSYFACGASAAAFGASVFKPDWLKAKDFKSIGFEIHRLIRALP